MRTRADVRNTSNSAQQVERVDIQLNIVAYHGPRGQQLDRSAYLRTRFRIKIGRAADKRVERGVHPMFRGDIVDEQKHPFPQRLDRGMRFGQPLGSPGELFRFVAINGLDQRVAIWEVTVEGPDPDLSRLRNFLQAYIRAFLGEGSLCSIEKAEPITFSVGARFTGRGRRIFFRQTTNYPLINGGFLRI